MWSRACCTTSVSNFMYFPPIWAFFEDLVIWDKPFNNAILPSYVPPLMELQNSYMISRRDWKILGLKHIFSNFSHGSPPLRLASHSPIDTYWHTDYCDYRPILDTDMEISEPMAEEFVQVAVPVFNQLVSSVRDLILVRDVISSLKVCHSHLCVSLSAIRCAADVIRSNCY